MYIVAIAWMYVVVLMSLAEATSPQGTILGAIVTFILYGIIPLSILMYILGTPARKRALRVREEEILKEQTSVQPDQGRLPAASPVTPEREKS